MTTSANPVFIIASERSGTNFLRVRLTEAQDLYYGASPAHLLKNLYFREPYFGSLDDDANFAALLKAALELCTVHFAPWDVDWTVESLMADYADRPRDTLFLMDFMMGKYAREQGRERYISKENFLYEFALDVATRLPGARFIFLYRDPRDVVSSQCIRQGNSKGVAQLARLWEYEQTRAIRVHEILARQRQSVAVSYEDLVSNEDAVVQSLIKFLGADRAELNDDFDERVDVVPHELKNLAKATMRDNFGKYRLEFSKRQIKVIEAICHLQMSYLGYELDHYSPGTTMRTALAFDRIMQAYDRVRVRLARPENRDPVFRSRFRLLGSLQVNYRSDR